VTNNIQFTNDEYAKILFIDSVIGMHG